MLIDRIHQYAATRRQAKAQDALAAMIAARRVSPDIVEFRRRRAAALRGLGG